MICLTRAALVAAILMLSGSVRAADFDPAAELANRTGLLPPQIGAMLADCDATQTSAYFCAWRDLIIAEHALELARAQRSAASSACKTAVDRQLGSWPAPRERRCEQVARHYRGGSMERTVRAQCAVNATQEMVKRLKGLRCNR